MKWKEKLILEERLEWEKSCGYREIRATGGMQAICWVGDGFKKSKNKPRKSQRLFERADNTISDDDNKSVGFWKW